MSENYVRRRAVFAHLLKLPVAEITYDFDHLLDLAPLWEGRSAYEGAGGEEQLRVQPPFGGLALICFGALHFSIREF